MKLFLGVDGGQSGTTAVVGDETGRVLGEGEAGPCNHAAFGEGRAKLERAVKGSVGAACAAAGLDPEAATFEGACFGMSGGPEDKREILAQILKMRRLDVTNDAVIALAGATGGGPGIITIAGTGSIALGRNAAGRVVRAGGWGYIFGDEGSAFDIARQALRAALRMEEGWGPATALCGLLLEATGAASANEVLHLFYTPEWPRSRVARLAAEVDRAAQNSDAVAQRILAQAAQELALLAAAVRGQLFQAGEAVEVAYVGGVFRSHAVRERFRLLVEMEDGARLIAPRFGPAEGALLEAYRAAGVTATIRPRGTAL
jgi:N-acetylglucosamine kinase-like BadF-type ATPase